SVTQTPIQTTHPIVDICCQLPDENTDRVKFRCRSFLTNHAGYSGAVSNSIPAIQTFAFRVEEDTTHNLPNVWMIRINSASDQADRGSDCDAANASSLILPPSSVMI